MSDNPLADWLRDGGAWAAGDPDVDGPPTALGPPPPPRQGADGEPAPAWQGADGDPAPAPLGEPDPQGDTDAFARVVPPFAEVGDDWDDEPRARPARSRRLLLLGLAVVPWLGFAAVALGTLGGTGATPENEPAEGARGAPADDADESTAPPPEDPAAPGAAPPPPEDVAGRAGAQRRAEAAASVAVRTAVAGEVADGDTVRYVDLAGIGSVEWIGDVAIVEVATVVLESTGDAWGPARPAWFAVPVHVTAAGPVPIADPWPLAPASRTEAPAWEAVADTDLDAAAARALTEGGYEDVTEVTAHRSDEVPGVLAVDVVAVAPGAGEAAGHRVWLRDADPPALLPASVDPLRPPADP